MPTKKAKESPQSTPKENSINCWCNEGWVCERHSDKPYEHDYCPCSVGMLCGNPKCDIDPVSVFAAVQACSIIDGEKLYMQPEYLSTISSRYRPPRGGPVSYRGLRKAGRRKIH
jgi:hypothetical protein